MTGQELRQMLPELQDMQFGANRSDVALIAYGRIFTVLHQLVFLNGLDDEFGDREIYRTKLDRLYDMLCQRYSIRTSFMAKASLLEAMICIVSDSGLPVDDRKRVTYEHLANELVSSYLDSFREESYGKDEFFSVMKLLLICMYGVVDGEEEEEPHHWMTFIRKKFAIWAKELDKKGYWPGISDVEALQRLKLLDMNCYMFLDERYDEEIRQGYVYYCAGRELSDNVSERLSPDILRSYVLQYEFIRQGSFNLWEHTGHLDRIVYALETYTDRLSATSDEALLYRSIVIENCCRNVCQEYQRRLCGITA